MDMIAEIRRRHLVSKESISSIARDLKLSRPTVRKHCRTQSEPVYQRHKQPTPVLGAFQETLETWLRTERLLPQAQRRTARRLFEGLQAEVDRAALTNVVLHCRAANDLPSESAGDLVRLARSVQANAGTFFALGLVGIIWSTLGFYSALESALNIVFRVGNRGFIRGKWISFVLVVSSRAV